MARSRQSRFSKRNFRGQHGGASSLKGKGAARAFYKRTSLDQTLLCKFRPNAALQTLVSWTKPFFLGNHGSL
jgi:hypothetical protein